MGINARISINDEWSEPVILWNVVAARKGEKKTAAMKRLLSAVEVMLHIISYRTLPQSLCIHSRVVLLCSMSLTQIMGYTFTIQEF